jgi:hypothetical protein
LQGVVNLLGSKKSRRLQGVVNLLGSKKSRRLQGVVNLGSLSDGTLARVLDSYKVKRGLLVVSP